MKDVKVGDTVYLLPVGNADRYTKHLPAEEKLQEATVTKVGRKYFYLDKHPLDKFGNRYDEDHRGYYQDVSEYSANYEVYLSKQALVDKHERERLAKSIGNVIYLGLSLDQLRRISEIINETEVE